jgi:hypothetical protein
MEQALKGIPGWEVSLLLVFIIVLLMGLVFYTVLYQGREMHLPLGFVIGRKRDGLKARSQESPDDLKASKVMYVKVLYLKRNEPGQKPVYQRVVKRLKGESVVVFDEEVYYSMSVFPREQERYSYTFRSSGVVDLRTVHPWVEHLRFADKGDNLIEGRVSQTVDLPSNVYLVVSHHCNGLQPGDEDVAMRADFDTSYARLVVDFSSLPNIDSLFKERPTAKFREGNSETLLGIEEYAPGIFSVTHKDIKKDSVLRIDFKIAWEKLSTSAA